MPNTTKQDLLTMNRGVAELTKKLDSIVHANWRDIRQVDEQDITEKLFKIWNIAMELQRDISAPAIVEGCRVDAVSQILRVGELIGEMDMDPDHRQLLSIGMATELAALKVMQYKSMARFSAIAEMNHKLAATEAA